MSVAQTARHHIHKRLPIVEIEVKFGRNIPDSALYLPDALAGAAAAVEDGDIVAVALRIVGTHKAEQSGFSGSVLPKQCPFLTCLHGPIDIVQNHAVAIAHIASGEGKCHIVIDRDVGDT